MSDEIRGQFDKWWDEKLSVAFHSCPKEHRDSAYHAAWLAYQEAWKASRSALSAKSQKRDIPLSQAVSELRELNEKNGFNHEAVEEEIRGRYE